MAALLAPLAVIAMNQPAKRTSIQIIESALVHLDVIGRKLEGASLNSEADLGSSAEGICYCGTFRSSNPLAR
jgi:hypothetical protein